MNCSANRCHGRSLGRATRAYKDYHQHSKGRTGQVACDRRILDMRAKYYAEMNDGRGPLVDPD